jgi:phosphoglycolate phosphatase-like HAD superfamily hydrolase
MAGSAPVADLPEAAMLSCVAGTSGLLTRHAGSMKTMISVAAGIACNTVTLMDMCGAVLNESEEADVAFKVAKCDKIPGGTNRLTMKLILFDIDGTLVSVDHDITMRAVEEVFRTVFDHVGDLPHLEFHGKTDCQIFLELCDLLGYDRMVAADRLPRMEDALVEGWRRHLAPEHIRVLDGVGELLEVLAERDDLCLGLLTGNLERSARLKLGPHGLDRYFSIGSFGSDAFNRSDLPPIALERATALHGGPFSYDRTLIGGDSHRDIACARAWGIRALAVATGSLSAPELMAHNPDALCESLLDSSYIFEFLSETP